MLKGTLRSLLFAALVAAATPPLAGAGEFELTIRQGRVTLVAQNAPIQDILAEWARIGQTKIVNGEKLTGSPLTLQLIDVPEEQALETLLRSASGYVVAPRATPIPGASRFDRIFILVSSGRPSTRAVMAPTPGVLQPAQGQPGEDVLFGAPASGEPDSSTFEYASPNQLEQLQQLLLQPGEEPQESSPPPTSPVDQPQFSTTPNFGPLGATRPGVVVNPPPNTRDPGRITSPFPGGVPPVVPQEPDAANSRRPPGE